MDLHLPGPRRSIVRCVDTTGITSASKDAIVEVTDEELDKMPLPTAKTIDVMAFVPAVNIDPLHIGDSYYLAVNWTSHWPWPSVTK
ncbi:Ku protein [Streptomyces agglomeratus]|uniref:Ku protein n=1 Tax=Streptomyces agglomeratus TaxID=285458 RepID=UPI003140C752